MLVCNEVSGKLEWAFDGLAIPTLEQITAEFQASKYNQYYLLEKELSDSINHLQQQQASPESPPPPAQALPVAEKRDAELSFEFGKAAMSADITVKAPYAGNIPDVNGLTKALAAANITNGIRHDILQGLPKKIADLQLGESLTQEIANGQLPEKGKNGYIEFLTASAKDRLLKPKVNKNGSVDMRDLGDPITVKPNQPLALRHPAELGIPGYDVTGKIIPPQAGKDIAIKAGDGSIIDPNNPDQLLATKEGLPLVAKDSVSVDDVMQLKKVDVSTGHVRFSGSLLIKGDVSEGMKVESDGDIHISGSVESATITAGGSITVNNGIIGHQLNDDDNLQKCSCKLNASGDITGQFAQYAELNSKNDIVLLKQSNHCNLSAKNKIYIGPPEKANGRLIGGYIEAEFGVDAGEIGAPSGAKTLIKMGSTLKKSKGRLTELADKTRDKYEAVQKAAHRVKSSHKEGQTELIAMALMEYKEYKQQYQSAQLALNSAKQQADRIQNGTATTALSKLHTRVSVTLGESTISTSREHGPSIVHFVDGKLAIEPKQG